VTSNDKMHILVKLLTLFLHNSTM